MDAEVALIVLLIFVVLTIILGIRGIYRHQTRVRRRLSRLLDALHEGDTTLRFPVDRDPEVNTSLNEIADCLTALRRDITERDAFFRHLTDEVSTGLLVVGQHGHVRFVNQSALRLLGRPALTHIEALSVKWPELASVLRCGKAGIDTTIKNLSVKTTVMVRADGERLTMAALDDITPQIAAASHESWADMSRVLTHEIMNSIAPIISVAETLRTRCDDADEGLRTALEAIGESGRGLMDFVGEYRRLTSLPPAVPVSFDLRQLIGHVGEIFRLSDERPLSVRTFFPQDKVCVLADRGQLRQVFVNIVRNAVDAGANCVTFRVDISYVGKVRVTIGNDGSPIAPEMADSIFTPFFSTKPGGSGIGLSLCRRMIAANGGSLTLADAFERPDDLEKTVFVITLPAA